MVHAMSNHSLSSDPSLVGVFAGVAVPVVAAFVGFGSGFVIDLANAIKDLPNTDYAESFAFWGAIAATAFVGGVNADEWNNSDAQQRTFSRTVAVTSGLIATGLAATKLVPQLF